MEVKVIYDEEEPDNTPLNTLYGRQKTKEGEFRAMKFLKTKATQWMDGYEKELIEINEQINRKKQQ